MTKRDQSSEEERVIWEGRTSWMDHALLYLLMAVALVRAAMAAQSGEWTAALLYAVAVSTFLGVAAWFHYSLRYRLTSTRVQILSGWSGQVSHEMWLKDISDVTLKYEPLNRWFDLGALELASRSTEDCYTIRGIPQPEQVQAQLLRWIRAHRSPWEPVVIRGADPTSRDPRHAQ